MKLIFLLAAASAVSLSGETLPKVIVLYPNANGTLFDRTMCEQKDKLDRNLTRTAAARVPEFQQQWDAEGPTYLAATYAEIGLPFPYREVQAVLSVCAPSISVPLMISVRPYLPDPPRIRPAWMFPFTVFHELMHTYQRPVFTSSAMRKKYAGEPEQVLSHIHVMAIEKFVLTKLGKADRLKELDMFYTTHRNPDYRRSWEIVNKIEDYKALIAELRASR